MSRLAQVGEPIAIGQRGVGNERVEVVLVLDLDGRVRGYKVDAVSSLIRRAMSNGNRLAVSVFIRSDLGGYAVPDCLSSSSVEVLDRALRDSSTPKHTRRSLLERAAVGAGGVAVAGVAVPAADALADDGHDSIQEFGVFASTTEAFTVTLLTELLRRVSLHPEVPAGVAVVFDGAYAAELDHWRFIRKFFRPTTKRFWIPDAVFGGAGNALDLMAVGNALVAGETLFVNTYLIGVTTFAAAGRSTFARYSAELAGVEAEHRVLAQTLINASPPDNVGFEVFRYSRVRAILAALEALGLGFGQQGAIPGSFYDFPRPPMPPPIPILSNKPR